MWHAPPPVGSPLLSAISTLRAQSEVGGQRGVGAVNGAAVIAPLLLYCLPQPLLRSVHAIAAHTCLRPFAVRLCGLVPPPPHPTCRGPDPCPACLVGSAV